jgi:hypothetical protein
MLPIMRDEGVYVLRGKVDIAGLLNSKPGQLIIAHPEDIRIIPAREWYEPIGDEL